MIIIPAIDLYQGKVVRLTKGDPSQSKVYSDNPVEVAKKWEKEGARLLHLVDLSAALGQGENLAFIRKVIEAVKIKVEVGGGIRDFKKAEELISMGAARVIIGTKGLEEDFLIKIIEVIGSDKLAVSVDVMDGFVAVKGWQEKTALKDKNLINHLQAKGVKWVIYTDISRDGTLAGINLENIKQFSVFKGLNLIISGGVSNLEDVRNIRDNAPFVWGVIVGKAIYEGKIDLPKAINLVKRQQ
ncbi:MAG: 1-(5-phosphoribosyl)-5-[(5-phosphoribosylamino)methylideneamino]imidazole-4-carboxamide isomerase [Candidatus Omnitrophota bacterium]|nr:1-(5-phosphoribosyl)-5-[(5-phosphoribosylamino)methylideneamino]imidazole-4-carboxamide isomerase [Candidatus Omnitrophota bacterium]